MTIEVRALLKSDDRKSFTSGDVELDRFFHQYAGQNQFKHAIGTTYVALNPDIVGYATVAIGELDGASIPQRLAKKLPNYPLPILRLARLATAQSARGTGVGKALLRTVLEIAVELSSRVGCVGVVVDAKHGAIPFYERYQFIALESVSGESPQRPRTSPMFLEIDGTLRIGFRSIGTLVLS
ncbi:MAG: GNAT family N-acetyltransferase, partial [Myxococcota bacterium]